MPPTEFFETLLKVVPNHAYQVLIIYNNFTMPFLNYKPLKL